MGREDKTRASAANGGEDVLARWSRRKLSARRDEPRDEPHTHKAEAAAAAVAPAEADKPLTDADMPPAEADKPLTDADMPPIESLDEQSDFSPFLSTGVSDGLRQKALRKLFSQPAYNITDGLNDYDEDFTRFAGLGKMITHEMKRVLQRELAGEKARADEVAVQTGETDAAVPADDATASDADDVASDVQQDEPGRDHAPSS